MNTSSGNVNKDYYDRIIATMQQMEAEGERPTVDDMIEAMRLQGNTDYYFAFLSQFNLYAKQNPMPQGSPIHEACHLIPRLGHTPLQEMMMFYFMLGMTHKEERMEDYPGIVRQHFISYGGQVSNYTASNYAKEKWANISARDKVVYFLAGIYAKQKIADYVAAMGAEDADYEKQKQFCQNYAGNDNVPVSNTIYESEAAMRRAPWHLLELSREEWRAITAVALGKATPEESAYPNRLGEAYKVLQKTGFLEELAQVQSQSQLRGR